MTLARLRHYLLPITLGTLGLILLVRLILVRASVLVPEDSDVLILVVLLAATMVIAVHTIVRISMSYLRLISVQQARRETLAEHSRFLRRLDHELKNPLTTLRAGLTTLSLMPLNEQQQQIVSTMELETLRLSRLVADLRKLADLETQPLNLQPVEMEPFVTGLVQQERERFEAGQRHLQSQVKATRPNWLVDEDLLALAVHNLLENAFKYTQPGDTITLHVSADQELIIRVTDSGMGIPPADLPHIWEELYRAGHQEKKVAGSGIGLALVKAIIERHGGTVNVWCCHSALWCVRHPPFVVTTADCQAERPRRDESGKSGRSNQRN